MSYKIVLKDLAASLLFNAIYNEQDALDDFKKCMKTENVYKGDTVDIVTRIRFPGIEHQAEDGSFKIKRDAIEAVNIITKIVYFELGKKDYELRDLGIKILQMDN